MTVCLDADCVIYFVEQNPVWGPRVTARLAVLRAAGNDIAVSDLARTECLARPLAQGNSAVIADYQAFFGDPAIRSPGANGFASVSEGIVRKSVPRANRELECAVAALSPATPASVNPPKALGEPVAHNLIPFVSATRREHRQGQWHPATSLAPNVSVRSSGDSIHNC